MRVVGHWPLEGSRVQAVAQLLQPERYVLVKAAPVVAAIVLPAGAAVSADVSDENHSAWMIVARRHSAILQRTGGMATFGVVGAIGGHLRDDFAFDLVQQP